MVVIGHSQGGLLTKLTAVDAGDRFWKLTSDEAIENLRMPPETRQVLIRSTFFTPQPFVKRVVFVCTPHRGSYLASLSLSRWGRLVRLAAQRSDRPPGRGRDAERGRARAALDRQAAHQHRQHEPRQRLHRDVAALPIAPGIRAHSIIARTATVAEDAVDGVVSYERASTASTQADVRSGHSARRTRPRSRRSAASCGHLAETPELTLPE
jgi:pimeloyl-ACP methyl ester carboxylesterase